MTRAVFFSLRLVNIVNYLAYDWRTVYSIQRHLQQYFSYIMAVSFIGWGNQSTQRKAQACRKSLRNVITLPRARFKLTTLVNDEWKVTWHDPKFTILEVSTLTIKQPMRFRKPYKYLPAATETRPLKEHLVVAESLQEHSLLDDLVLVFQQTFQFFS